jgi:hypothetical protein
VIVMSVTQSKILVKHHFFLFRFSIFQILNAVSSQIVNLILLVTIVILELTLKVVTGSDEKMRLAVYASIKLIIAIIFCKWRVIIFTVITWNFQNVFVYLFFSLFCFLFLMNFLFCYFFFLYQFFYFIKVFIFNVIFIFFHFNFCLFFFKFYFLWSFTLTNFFDFSVYILLLLMISILFYFLWLLKTGMTKKLLLALFFIW